MTSHNNILICIGQLVKPLFINFRMIRKNNMVLGNGKRVCIPNNQDLLL
jgi:hypothetical protein